MLNNLLLNCIYFANMRPQTKLLCDGMAYILGYITRVEFVLVRINAKAIE